MGSPAPVATVKEWLGGGGEIAVPRCASTDTSQKGSVYAMPLLRLRDPSGARDKFTSRPLREKAPR